MTTVTQTALGYKATREGEALVVHDVPIFCACERGDFVADEAWIASAVARGLAKAREGYLPPLHTRHHEKGTEPCAAGYFRITRSGPLTLDGKRRLAVFADLVITDPVTADAVLRMRYPYRSVEIFDVEGEPSIDSLALLDHEAPFLEMPMLAIAQVEERESAGVPGFDDVATFCRGDLLDLRANGSPVVALFRRGSHARLLFREGESMAEEMKAETEDKVAEDPKLEQQNFADDDKKDKDKDGEDMQEGGLDVSAVVKAIESGEIPIKDFDAILAAIQKQQSATEEAPEEEAPAPAAAPGESMAKDTGDATAFAKMQAKIVALEAKDKERDAADKRKTDVAAAMSRLADRPLGADLEDRLVAFHKEHGGKAFSVFVDELAKAAGPVGDDDSPAIQVDQSTPKLAMKFMELGTGAVDKAAHYCQQWEDLQRHGLRVSREAFVKQQMTRAGFRLDESA